MMVVEPSSDVARAIQLALAPVFLLTGISGLLNVMTGRLSRIIDRGRALTEERDDRAACADELRVLERRRYVVSVAITACTVAALLLCLVIVTLFVEAMLSAPLEWLVGTLFTASVLGLVVGLAFFLREVHMATGTIRIHRDRDPSASIR